MKLKTIAHPDSCTLHISIYSQLWKNFKQLPWITIYKFFKTLKIIITENISWVTTLEKGILENCTQWIFEVAAPGNQFSKCIPLIIDPPEKINTNKGPTYSANSWITITTSSASSSFSDTVRSPDLKLTIKLSRFVARAKPFHHRHPRHHRDCSSIACPSTAAENFSPSAKVGRYPSPFNNSSN